MRLSKFENDGEISDWIDLLEGLSAKEIERAKTLDRAAREEVDIFFLLFRFRAEI